MEDIFSHMIKKRVLTPRGPLTYWVCPCSRGPVLVFLHSLLSDHREFRAQAEAFQGRSTMIFWDSPGHGESRPWDVFTYTYGAMALEAVLRQEGCLDPVLIGQGHGSAIAQAYLRSHTAAGFLSVSGQPFGPQYYSPREKQKMLGSLWRSHCHTSAGIRRQLIRISADTKEGRQLCQPLMEPYSTRELHRLLTLGFCSFQKENQELALPCPGVLLCGDRDRLGNTLHRTELWADHTGLPWIRVPEAGHLLSLDAPQALNRAIASFPESHMR